MPSLTWYGSPNFTPGRIDVEYVVIHWMDGYLSGADATFQNTARQTSAHYGVEDDVIHQYVDEANTAWHAGNYDANQRSIGIEHSAMPGRPASDATYASTIWLITGICQRYGLDPAIAILPHQHFTATSCPGTMDLPRIIAGVQAALGGGVTAQSGTITPITQDWTDMATQAEVQAACEAAVANQLANLRWVTGGRSLFDAGTQTLNSLDTISAKIDAAVKTGIPLGLLTAQFRKKDGTVTSVAAALGELLAQPGTTPASVDVKTLAAELLPLLPAGPTDLIAELRDQFNK